MAARGSAVPAGGGPWLSRPSAEPSFFTGQEERDIGEDFVRGDE